MAYGYLVISLAAFLFNHQACYRFNLQKHSPLSDSLAIILRRIRLTVSKNMVLSMDKTELKLSVALSPAEPLWKLAPTRDEDGNPVSDLLMIIPKLKTKPEAYIKDTLANIEFALKQFSDDVLFANVDMKLNTLWVSFRAVPGIYGDIVATLRSNVPEAVIVGDTHSRLKED